MAPVHGPAQRLLAFRKIPRAAGQQPQPALQSAQNCARRQDLHSRRRQLDGQRQTIQTRTNLHHCRRIVFPQDEAGLHRTRALDKKRDSGIL